MWHWIIRIIKSSWQSSQITPSSEKSTKQIYFQATRFRIFIKRRVMCATRWIFHICTRRVALKSKFHTEVTSKSANIVAKISNIEHGIWNVKYQTQDLRYEIYEISNNKHEVQESKCQVSNTRSKIQNMKYKIWNIKYQEQQYSREASSTTHGVARLIEAPLHGDNHNQSFHNHPSMVTIIVISYQHLFKNTTAIWIAKQ